MVGAQTLKSQPRTLFTFRFSTFTRLVIIGKVLNLPISQFLYLCDRDNNSTYHIRFTRINWIYEQNMFRTLSGTY